jgi:galactitol-specific phosphotransferase system IIC component
VAAETVTTAEIAAAVVAVPIVEVIAAVAVVAVSNAVDPAADIASMVMAITGTVIMARGVLSSSAKC